MHQIDVSVEEKVLQHNRDIADGVEALLEKHGIAAVDFTGAIGSGKTLLIERLIEEGKRRGLRCAAVSGDSTGSDDYERMVAHGIPARNINTGKECHLDAHLLAHALEHLDLDSIDVIFVENVGNLLCPSDFPLGTQKRLVVISTTEGDDMVRKHPNIFSLADAMVVNKADLAPLVDVDIERIISDFRKVAPHGRYFVTNARGGEGLDKLADYVFGRND